MQISLVFSSHFLSLPLPVCCNHIKTCSKYFFPLNIVDPFLSVSSCSSSLKHTRALFKADLFLQVEHNIYSSVCRASVFIAHLLLPSENIIPPTPPCYAPSGDSRDSIGHFFTVWLLQYFKCPSFFFAKPWHLTQQQPRGMGKKAAFVTLIGLLLCSRVFSPQLPGYLALGGKQGCRQEFLLFCSQHHCPEQFVLQFECHWTGNLC